MKAGLLLALAVGLEVTGSLTLSAAQQAPWLYTITAIGYVGAFFLLSLVLHAGMPLGVAYGIWGACGVVLTAVLGALLFGDPLTPWMGVGIVLIVGGVVLVELGGSARKSEESA